MREEPGHALSETLAAALGPRRLLLVLDNCEHVVDATADLADALLRAAPELTILATSRQPLRIGGERVWRTPTLPVPPAGATSPEAALEFDAVRLFAARASDTDERFTVSADSVSAVAEICRRLDGIPLALELAAARISALTPSQIAARLDDRFRLLRSGSRAAPERQQTLAAAVQWSHDLCSSSEQALFRRLSIFAGGFTLAAAETVCADEAVPREEVLDLLSALVDRSMVVVQHRGDNVRYQMLETIRAYAEKRLVDAGEERAVRDAHVAWVVSFAESMAEELAPELVTPRGILDRFELEHDNVRRALGWASPVDPDAVLRIVAAILPIWSIRGHMQEIGHWSEFVLTPATNGSPALRARVLQGAGRQALVQGHPQRGRTLLQEAGAVFRQLGDERSFAGTLGALIQSTMDQGGDYDEAERLAQECVAVYQQQGDQHLSSEALSTLALVAIERGNDVVAQDLIAKALCYNRQHVDDPCPTVLNAAGRVAFLAGDRDAARSFLAQNLHHARDRGLRGALGSPLYWLGELALLEDDVDEADRRFSEQLSLVREWRAWRGIRLGTLGTAKVSLRRGDVAAARSALDGLRQRARVLGDVGDPAHLECAAALLVAEGRPEAAARVLGAAEAHRTALGAPVPSAYRASHQHLVSEVASHLDKEVFDAAWAGGRQVPAQVALDEAFDT